MSTTQVNDDSIPFQYDLNNPQEPVSAHHYMQGAQCGQSGQSLSNNPPS